MTDRPGPKNSLCDIDGIRVGHGSDRDAMTGVTVIDVPVGSIGAVDVRGGGPASRETDLLAPDNMVPGPTALCLSGGSVYGLAAADRIVAILSGEGRGFPAAGLNVPIVPAASLFDLNRGHKTWLSGGDNPYARLADAAWSDLSTDVKLGSVGAGTGATAGPLKGGIGSASWQFDDGITVAALAAVNPVGEVVIPGTDIFNAWALEELNEFGGRRPVAGDVVDASIPIAGDVGTQTTLGVVAVNRALDKATLKRIAVMAHDGLARAIRPVHTPFDGDIVFALGVGEASVSADATLVARLGARAADCMARAICRAVYEAESLGGIPSYRG